MGLVVVYWEWWWCNGWLLAGMGGFLGDFGDVKVMYLALQLDQSKKCCLVLHVVVVGCHGDGVDVLSMCVLVLVVLQDVFIDLEDGVVGGNSGVLGGLLVAMVG